MNYITLPGCFVLKMDKFPPRLVGRFDVMFIEDPPEFLRYSREIGNDDVVHFSVSSSLYALDVSDILTKVPFG